MKWRGAYGPGGMVLEQVSGSATLWYHHEQLGSVRAITDSAGNVKVCWGLVSGFATVSTEQIRAKQSG